MARALVLSVRFHDGRYHGAGDWPPAPARLFQALVAGAARGEALVDGAADALRWLESLPPPVIAAPAVRIGQGFKNFVPNNDLDAHGGDPRCIAEIRTPKMIKPRLFDAEATLRYAWSIEKSGGSDDHARIICAMAERLYQVGRGVDMAWAWAEILADAEMEAGLACYAGAVHRPAKGAGGNALLCPQPGSLASLVERFAANGRRFTHVGKGAKAELLFTQPPKPRFAAIPYDSPPQHFLFDVRTAAPTSPFVPWPLRRAVELVLTLRDAAGHPIEASAA